MFANPIPSSRTEESESVGRRCRGMATFVSQRVKYIFVNKMYSELGFPLLPLARGPGTRDASAPTWRVGDSSREPVVAGRVRQNFRTSALRMATALLLCLLPCLGASGGYLSGDAASCRFGELPCDSGQCIGRKGWCDGPPDCRDASDETFCRTVDENGSKNPNHCDKSRHFVCENGPCIPRAGRCDDMPDCENGEDEENCDYSYDVSEDAESELSTTTATPPAKPLTWMPSRFDALLRSVNHVIEMRDSRWGWGRATPKVVTALSLANGSYFDLDNHDGLMTKKQLEVQLALDLMKHAERPLRMHDLVHYVHGLVATCLNPKDFHGVNVVRLLKRAMARRQSKGLFVNPTAYLALCNARDFSDSYLRRLKNMAYRRSEEQRWLGKVLSPRLVPINSVAHGPVSSAYPEDSFSLPMCRETPLGENSWQSRKVRLRDIQAYALMTISCRTLTDRSNAEEWLLLKRDVAKNITEWQQADGSFGNVHSTGLALQALIAAEEPDTESSRGRATTHLLLGQDSFGRETDALYVLPALNAKSLAHVHAVDCGPDPRGTQNEGPARHRGTKRPTIVHYSLWMGGEKNEMHTLTLGLPKHSNFLEVMEAAEKMNPRYKHEILTTSRGTTVHSIAGRSSDVERSTYWTLYRRVPLPFRPNLANTTATVDRLKLFGAKRWIRDLRKLHPKEGEHLAFWYQPYL